MKQDEVVSQEHIRPMGKPAAAGLSPTLYFEVREKGKAVDPVVRIQGTSDKGREVNCLRAGKIAGVQFILNKWFFALIFVFTMAGLGVKVAGVFAVVLWHEIAHCAMAAALGYRVREIELLPFGGVARIDRISEAGSISEIMMAAAGPISSLVMAAVIYLAMHRWPQWSLYLSFYLKVNLMLAIFNLLPAMPLDGGRILRALLALHWDYSTATSVVCTLSKVMAVALVTVTVLELYLSRTLNITLIIAAVLLYIAAKTENAVAGFRNMRVLANKKAELSIRGFMPTVHLVAVAGVAARDVLRRIGPEQYYIVLVVDKKFHLQGMLTETEVWEALPVVKGIGAKISDLL